MMNNKSRTYVHIGVDHSLSTLMENSIIALQVLSEKSYRGSRNWWFDYYEEVKAQVESYQRRGKPVPIHTSEQLVELRLHWEDAARCGASASKQARAKLFDLLSVKTVRMNTDESPFTNNSRALLTRMQTDPYAIVTAHFGNTVLEDEYEVCNFVGYVRQADDTFAVSTKEAPLRIYFQKYPGQKTPWSHLSWTTARNLADNLVVPATEEDLTDAT